MNTRARLALQSSLLVILALVAGVLTGASAHAAEDSGSLTVSIDTLSPSRLSAGATITMAGTVRNSGKSTWTAAQAYLVIAPSPFTTRREIEDSIEDGRSYTGERIFKDGRYDELGDLAPGASVRFRVQVPVSELGLTGPGGVYPVGVQILATDEDGTRSNEAVARATTFLPWLSDPGQPIAAGMIWPFVPTWGVTSRNGPALAASATSGRLRHYLDAARTVPRAGRTLLLDPSILDELEAVAAELTESTDATSEAAAEGVNRWLADLRTLVLESTTWVVDYGRPDTLALTRYPADADQLLTTADQATTEALVQHSVSGSRAAWPTINGVTRDLLEQTRQRADLPTVVSRGSVPDWEPRLGSVVNLKTDDGPLPLVVNGALPDVPGVESPVTVRQRILTDAALAELSRESDPESRADALTFINPSWDPGPAGGATLAEAVTTIGSGGLTRPVTAGDLLRSSPSTYSGDLPNEVTTTSLGRDYLGLVARLDDLTRTFDQVVADEDEGAWTRTVTSALSVRWRSHQSEAAERVGDAIAVVSGELDNVKIESPSTITLSSNRGGFPLTISNDTKHPIVAGLSLMADNPSLEIDDVKPVEIAAGERRTLTVEANLGEQTSSTVTAHLTSSEGSTFGTSQSFNIRSSNVGLFVWIAMGAAGALFVATWARRFLGRRRRHV